MGVHHQMELQGVPTERSATMNLTEDDLVDDELPQTSLKFLFFFFFCPLMFPSNVRSNLTYVQMIFLHYKQMIQFIV